MTTTFLREVCLSYRGTNTDIFSVIKGPETAADFIRSILPDNVREHLVALFLTANHNVGAYAHISTGTASSCPVHPREVFQPAIMAGACALILAHNHPSGGLEPSAEDRAVTDRLRESGTLLGIRLLDHIIVNDTEYVSFSNLGLL